MSKWRRKQWHVCKKGFASPVAWGSFSVLSWDPDRSRAAVGRPPLRSHDDECRVRTPDEIPYIEKSYAASSTSGTHSVAENTGDHGTSLASPKLVVRRIYKRKSDGRWKTNMSNEKPTCPQISEKKKEDISRSSSYSTETIWDKWPFHKYT